MKFQTTDQKYSVVQKLHGSPSVQAYLCTCGDPSDQKTVLVAGIADRALSEKFLPFLLNLPGRGAVGGFRDSFVRDEAVWIVSDYSAGTPFFEKADETLPAEEKIALAEALAEQIFARNLPPYFQYEALHPENIVVSPSRGVCVNFLPFAPELLGGVLFPDVQRRFSDCLRALFGEELKNKASQELSDFVGQLCSSAFSGDAALFGAFRRMISALQTAHSEGKLTRKGFLLRLWNRAADKIAALPALLYWMLVGALSGLLLFVCLAPETAPAQRNLIQNIGILRIAPRSPAGSTETDGEADGTGITPAQATPSGTEALPDPTESTQSINNTDSTQDAHSADDMQSTDGSHSTDNTQSTDDTQSTQESSTQPEMG